MDKNEYIKRYQQMFQNATAAAKGNERRWHGVRCPEHVGKPCMLCNIVRPILFKKDQHSESTVDRAYDLAQKTKYFSNVVRKEDPNKVVIFDYGKSIFSDLSDAQVGLDDPAVKNFFSFKSGRNVLIIKKGHGRQTEYKVRFKDPSACPDKYLAMAYDLDDIERLRSEEGGATIVRAAQLEQGPNEMRFLPNWKLGEEVELFFYSWKHHTGLTDTEFQQVQNGQWNPFDGEIAVDPSISTDESSDTIAFTNSDEEDVPLFDDTNDGVAFADDEENLQSKPTDIGEEEFNKPSCYANVADFEIDDDECTQCPFFKPCGEAVKKVME